MQNFPVTVNIRIPSTGSDWELYTCSEPEACEKAAVVITDTLKFALTQLGADLDAGVPVVDAISKADKTVGKAMRPFAKLGAYDSEPFYHLESAIQRYVEAKLYGKFDKNRVTI